MGRRFHASVFLSLALVLASAPAFAQSAQAQPAPRASTSRRSAGYKWDSVGALILHTNPPKARVSLDGVYVGTADQLGPIQLPKGEHTLHIEAPGYEPSDTIVKFDKPGAQTLNVELKRRTPPAPAKPAPGR